MYRPSYTEADGDKALDLMHAEPFATVITQDGSGAPCVSHLPLIVEPGQPPRLLGHMARRNPQWEHMRDTGKALAIFHGPHTYITPRWYSKHNVPTWNYAVVHVEGPVRLLETPKELARLLTLATARFEGTGPDAWRYSLPDDLKGEGVLTGAIIGFEITVERLDAKFKLSQNRNEIDRHAVIAGLEARGDEQSMGVMNLMRGGKLYLD